MKFTPDELDFTFRFYEMKDGTSLSEIEEWIKELKEREKFVKKGDGSWFDKVNEKFSIINVARSFGLNLRGSKIVCPFHADNDPSLMFYDDTGTFKCYGCGITGNLVDFADLCEKHNLKRDGDISWGRKK